LPDPSRIGAGHPRQISYSFLSSSSRLVPAGSQAPAAIKFILLPYEPCHFRRKARHQLQIFSASRSRNIPGAPRILRLSLQRFRQISTTAATGERLLPPLEQVGEIIAATTLPDGSGHLIYLRLLPFDAALKALHGLGGISGCNSVSLLRGGNYAPILQLFRQ
jgi:hypothetical protein